MVHNITCIHGNATPAVRAAIDALGEGGILSFERGIYHFYSDGAAKAEYWPSNNDGSVKTAVFHLAGKRDIMIDGGGSEFIFHGRLSPFIADNCSGLDIGNFTVDYSANQYGQGLVAESDPDGITLEFGPDFPCHADGDGTLVFCGDGYEMKTNSIAALCQEFDISTRAPAYNAPCFFMLTGKDAKAAEGIPPVGLMYTTAKNIAKNTIRLDVTGENTFQYRPRKGRAFIMTYENRENSGFFVTDCKNVRFHDISIYRCPSMGIICQLTENIAAERVKMCLKEGREGFVSINADATHFVNCTGRVRLEDCVFENMMDDGTNIHGIYTKILAVNKNTLTVALSHYQQHGVNIYKTGDTVDIMKRGALEPICRPKVLSSRLSDDKSAITLETGTELEGLCAEGDICENSCRMPSVYISGCRTGRNRPRGFLVSTPKPALIENNVFYNSACGIHITGDANYWYEAGSVKDVTIRRNIFDNCCYNWCDYAVLITPEFDLPGRYMHSGVKITDNIVKGFGQGIVYAKSVRGLEVRGNEIVKTDSYPTRGEFPAVSTHNCADVNTDTD